MRRWTCVLAAMSVCLLGGTTAATAQPTACQKTSADDPDCPTIFYVPYPAQTGATIAVGNGTALQNALNTAAGGQTIVLTPGVTYYPPAGSGTFVLPAISSADDSNWIVVRSGSSTFDAGGAIPPNTRVDTSGTTRAQMAHVRSTGAGMNGAFTTAPGAHHIRLVGLDISADSGVTVGNMVQLGGGEWDVSQLPTDIVLDRCYVHGADSGSFRRGVTLNGIRLAVVESYVSNFHYDGAQTQGIGGWNGPGPFKIVNNYIEATGENIMFGGSDPLIANLVPSDIEVRRNLVTKAGGPGAPYSFNALELKNARRLLIEGNIFEKVSNTGQDGTAILMKSVNQGGGCWWCVTEHVTFRNNIVRHAGSCFNIAANPNEHGGLAQPLNHVRIENVVCDDVGGAWSGSSRLAVVQDASPGALPSYVKMIHVTTLTNASNILAVQDTDSVPNFTWAYNLVERRCYGINWGPEEGAWSFSSNGPMFPSVYLRNVLVNTSSQCADAGQAIGDAALAARYPNPNLTFVAAGWSATQIDLGTVVSAVGSQTLTYRLAAASPYARGGAFAAGDGKDMGADTDALFAAFNGSGGSASSDGGSGGGSSIGTNIGSVGLAGTASVSGGLYTVSGAGAGTWGAADSFMFVPQPLSGDGEIIARITSLQYTNTFAKAGIMIRESLDPSAAHVILDVRPTADLEFMTRSSSGAATTFLATAVQAPPVWLKLVRSGTTVIGFVSADGTSWRIVGTTALNIGATAYVGLVVASADSAQLNTATFDNVAVLPGGGGGRVLPPPWTAQDVGAVDRAGSTSYADGVFSVSGAGTIWGASDTFQFVSQTVTGDVTIVARLTSLQNTSPFAKGGIMLRESAAPGSAHVILDVRPTGDVEFMTRSTAGAATIFLGTTWLPPAAWLRLVRTGSRVTASVSADGVAWTVIGSTTLNISTSALAGLVVCSVAPNTTNTVTFDNVAVGAVPAPWMAQDVGAVDAAGTTGYANGVFSVSGAGTIWGTADSFQFVSQPVAGDVTIVARLTTLQNTNPFAKAGIMLRESAAPNAPHVILDVRPTGDLEFMTRSTAGVATTYLGTARQPPAAWLRLVRSGATVTAAVSADGAAWTVIGSTTLNISTTALAGLVVCSVAPNTLNTATFDSIAVR